MVVSLAATSAVVSAVTPLVNLLLTFKLQLGVAGAGLAAVAASGCGLLTAVALIWRSNSRAAEGRKVWRGWSKQSLRQWRPYLKVSCLLSAGRCCVNHCHVCCPAVWVEHGALCLGRPYLEMRHPWCCHPSAQLSLLPEP
jgi:hypothetical protein